MWPLPAPITKSLPSLVSTKDFSVYCALSSSVLAFFLFFGKWLSQHATHGWYLILAVTPGTGVVVEFGFFCIFPFNIPSKLAPSAQHFPHSSPLPLLRQTANSLQSPNAFGNRFKLTIVRIISRNLTDIVPLFWCTTSMDVTKILSQS